MSATERRSQVARSGNHVPRLAGDQAVRLRVLDLAAGDRLDQALEALRDPSGCRRPSRRRRRSPPRAPAMPVAMASLTPEFRSCRMSRREDRRPPRPEPSSRRAKRRDDVDGSTISGIPRIVPARRGVPRRTRVPTTATRFPSSIRETAAATPRRRGGDRVRGERPIAATRGPINAPTSSATSCSSARSSCSAGGRLHARLDSTLSARFRHAAPRRGCVLRVLPRVGRRDDRVQVLAQEQTFHGWKRLVSEQRPAAPAPWRYANRTAASCPSLTARPAASGARSSRMT